MAGFDLNLAKKGRKNAPWSMWLYGQIGTGKSSMAAQIPNHIFIPTEDGVNFIDEANTLPECKTLDEFLGWINTLCQGGHSYETAVIDGSSGLDILVNKALQDENGGKPVEQIPYGGGKKLRRDKWLYVTSQIERLKRESGMNFIILGHSDVNKFQDPEGEPYDEYVPRLFDPEARNALMDRVDFLLFAKFKVYKSHRDAGFNKTETKASGGTERVIMTQNSATHWAKTRVALPAEIDYTNNYQVINQIIAHARGENPQAQQQ